ncbi:MAG: multicopper oxidase domain-containing protein [Salinirussus sp.]
MPQDRHQALQLTRDLSERLTTAIAEDAAVSRRAVLGGLGLAGATTIGLTGGGRAHSDHGGSSTHGNFGPTGEYSSNQFDPHAFLREFNTGFETTESIPRQRVYERDDGEGGTERVREFTLAATLEEIEIAPGVTFPAWTYNGQVPGPTLRVTEGDVVRVKFVNGQRHAHTIHPHLKNLNPAMDGIPQNGPGVIDQGDDFTYEWQAQPAGLHLYHCHSLPLKEHIHRGLYGAIIVDPDPDRVERHPRDYVNYHGPIDRDYRSDLRERAELRNHEERADEVDELVMVMNGFDTNFDGDNEVYAANTRAFAYGVGETNGYGTDGTDPYAKETIYPIKIDRTERQRIYLLNLVEFDPINSLHTHSQFFNYYDHGTTLYPTDKTVDTIMQCQAQRGIIELDYGDHEPGLYMFHAHQSEFAELGWMSFFEVV